MTGEDSNLQGELDLVWKHLLPAIKGMRGKIPEDPNEQCRHRKLLQRDTRFSSRERHRGRESSNPEPPAGHISGKSFKLGTQ